MISFANTNLLCSQSNTMVAPVKWERGCKHSEKNDSALTH